MNEKHFNIEGKIEHLNKLIDKTTIERLTMKKDNENIKGIDNLLKYYMEKKVKLIELQTGQKAILK